MTVGALVEQARAHPGVEVLEPCGLPVLEPGHVLPDDVRALYTACGGLRFTGWSFQMQVVRPARFVRTNDVLYDEPVPDDRSPCWYVLCEESEWFGSERISIDVHPARAGRCYNSFYDRHAMPGYCEVVARSLPGFLARMLAVGPDEHGELVPFWLGDDFDALGDAFD